jgi:hypothetical protein
MSWTLRSHYNRKTNERGRVVERKPIMLTIKEAAAIVDGLTAYRIRQMCLDGSLPHIMAGKKYLINQAVLLNVIGEGTGHKIPQ